MALWVPSLNQDTGKKFLGIVQALEADIYAGRIKPGDRLPSQRAIAEALKVDLTTVTRAFNEARRRGLVEANKGGGTYIRDSVQQQLMADKLGLLDLSMNNPPQPAAANLQQRLPEGIAGLIADQRRMLQLHYQNSAGNLADREAAAFWLQKKVQGLGADRVLIAAGAQSALFAVCRHLLKAGSKLLTPAYTYPGLKAVAAQLNIDLMPLQSDEQGIVPEAFQQACQSRDVEALYLVPAMDNPTAITMPLRRRQALAEIARQHGIAIIEDDPYSPLQSAPLPAFAELLPEQTWHIATLSKCATPALRVAFVITPDAVSVQSLATILRATNLMAPPLMCALVTRWIYDGSLDDIAIAIRQENNLRQQLIAELLPQHDYTADKDGHHIWLRLPAHWHADEFAREAHSQGVTIVPASHFAITDIPLQAVRVSLGLAVDSEALSQAVQILARLLAQTQQTERAVV